METVDILLVVSELMFSMAYAIFLVVFKGCDDSKLDDTSCVEGNITVTVIITPLLE